MRVVKKKKLLTIYAAGAAAIALVGYVFVKSFLLPTLEIRELVITGESDAQALTDVRRAVEGELDGGFFTQDLEKIKEAVERLTWVKSVTVTRLWPDAVNVTISRLEPVARWEDGRLVSAEGTVYVPLVENTEKTDSLPLIVADTTMFAKDAVKYLSKFSEIARKVDGVVKSIAISYRGSWAVTLQTPKENTLRIELGRATTSDVLFDRLSLVLENYSRVCETLAACPQFVDARYENAFAVRWPQVKPATKTEKQGDI